MIFHIKVTCTECSDHEFALVEAKDLNQAERIAHIVRENGLVRVLNRIEPVERLNRSLLRCYAVLGLRWLRATDKGWRLIEPHLATGVAAHRVFLDMEHSDNIQSRINKLGE